jgi:hypothetical protein
MPLYWTVSHEEELVVATMIGEITADELQAYLGAVIAERAMPYGKIFDLTQAGRLTGKGPLSEVGDTVRLYDKMKLGPIGPLAIVAPTEEAASSAMAFLEAARAQRPAGLFGTVEEARSWLALERAGRDLGTSSPPP